MVSRSWQPKLQSSTNKDVLSPSSSSQAAVLARWSSRTSSPGTLTWTWSSPPAASTTSRWFPSGGSSWSYLFPGWWSSQEDPGGGRNLLQPVQRGHVPCQGDIAFSSHQTLKTALVTREYTVSKFCVTCTHRISCFKILGQKICKNPKKCTFNGCKPSKTKKN